MGREERRSSGSDEQRSSRVAELDFAALFEEFRPRLIARLHRELPRDRVEDVVQETFARAWRARHQFDLERPVWPWLLAIAQHLVIDLRRHESTHHEVLTAIDEDVDAPERENPEGVCLHHELAEDLDAALACLIPRQRRVLEMRNRGWSYQELASIEDMTIVGVRSLLSRARRMARVAYVEITEDGRRVVVGSPALRWAAWRWRRAAGRGARALGQVADLGSVGAAASYLAGVAVSVAIGFGLSPGAPGVAVASGASTSAIARAAPSGAFAATAATSAPAGRREQSARPERGTPQSPAAVSLSVPMTYGESDSVTPTVVGHFAGLEPIATVPIDVPCGPGSLTWSTTCRVLERFR